MYGVFVLLVTLTQHDANVKNKRRASHLSTGINQTTKNFGYIKYTYVRQWTVLNKYWYSISDFVSNL
jgi:hypothetical protein